MNEIVVESPITGVVIEIAISLGEAVSPGDVLLVIESMKMENDIISAHTGRVKEISVRDQELVSEGEPMVTLTLS